MQLWALFAARTASGHHKPRSRWTAAEWARVRAPFRHRDAELSTRTRRWFSRLPGDVQPHALCAQFPRIANQLAACWGDVGLIEHLLENLTLDHRGGRHGFPQQVADDIARLYDYHALRVDVFNAALQASPDEENAAPSSERSARRGRGAPR